MPCGWEGNRRSGVAPATVWYGMVNVDLYSAIITKVSNVLNTLVSGEKPGFQTLSKGLAVLLCSEVVRQILGHASQTSVVYPHTGSRAWQGDEHPAYALLWSVACIPFTPNWCAAFRQDSLTAWSGEDTSNLKLDFTYNLRRPMEVGTMN